MPVQCTPYPDNVNYEKQSIIVPGTKQPGQTAHYRNALFGLVDANGAGVLTTLPEVFNNGFALDPDARLFGHRPLLSKAPLKFGPYVWQTYREVDVRRRRIGSALHRMFNTGELKAADLESVGIWSQNRPEWQLVDLALQAYGKVGVSLYDTLGKDSVEYIINHAQLSIVFTTADHIAALLRLSAKIPSLKVIVSFDSLDDGVRSVLSSWAESLGIRIMHLSEVEHYGEEYLIEPFAASPDQIANLCYTSGTTNNPKGVILTHGNLASAVYSLMFGAHFPTSCCLISYLPLAHIYERIIELTIMSIGGCVGYFTGDPLRLMEDAQALKPHLFPAVPRVLNRVYQAAMAAGDVPGLKGAIFRTALQTKLDQLRKTGVKTHALWDTLVFRKIRAVLGGNVTALFTGSAPISGEVIDFLKIAFGCEVLEGRYGMTENCGVCSHTIDGDATGAGTIGPPNPVIEIKLVDIPAMNYLSTDKPNPRGELCVRGPNCFQGYYKDEKTTQETIKDGWTHTGDVAEIDKYGRFKIIDRVKNIMKLSQGEYVALEKVENMYNASPIVQQLYVHGDALQSYLVAVIVPDPLVLAPVVSAILGRKVEPTDNLALVEAVKDPRVVQEVLNLLNAEAKKKKLAGFEMIKRIHLTMDPFTVEENTLTPTFKLRRRDAYAKFKKELDALYALGEPTNGLSFKL